MPPSTREAAERLAWDSAFFGVSIGRVAGTRPTGEDLARALRWASDASIDCLYLLADAGDPAAVRAAEAHGFSLADIRVTLDRPAAGPSGGEDGGIRAARVEDVPGLAAIARASHRNTRFHRDTRFDARRADEMYAVWIERAVKGELADRVWVVDEGNGPAGYLAAARGDASASIGLVAVDAACRGRGYGERLVGAVLRWAAAAGAARISVVTQGQEPSALRFYERAGFTTRRVQLWYHYWPRRPQRVESMP
jgi:ribosomal protein S18 acetylase RimI-like enzyme